ncbi:MAG: alpha/beta hydrolase family protein [Acidimicrobiia bacterium]
MDQRAHGDSEGQAHVQDPTKETEDVKAVIDHVAKLEWVKLDRPGDPVLAAIGGSYGGGYQTMTALDEIHETGRTRFRRATPRPRRTSGGSGTTNHTERIPIDPAASRAARLTAGP